MIKFNRITILKKIILIGIMLILITVIPNNISSLPYIGGITLAISLYNMFYFRDRGYITILTSMIALINILIVFSVCINPYNQAMNWQIVLVNMPQNIIMAKATIIFSTFLFLGLGRNNIYSENLQVNKIKYEPSIIPLIFCWLFLGYALVFGYDKSIMAGSEGYVSNANPVYEYAIVIFTFVWLISRKNKISKICLIAYSIVYCLQALIYGDRSACFPMLIVVFMLNLRKTPKIKTILIFALGGILLSNLIDIFRNQGLGSNLISNVLSRGLHVNTVSYSFYTGTQIVRYSEIINNGMLHFIEYVQAILLGNTSKLSLSVMANSQGLINKGGGFFASYLYFWGGYAFVIINGYLTGVIIKKVMISKKRLGRFCAILVVAYLIRWYVYYPIALWRSALFIPILIYGMYTMYTKIFRRTHRK